MRAQRQSSFDADQAVSPQPDYQETPIDTFYLRSPASLLDPAFDTPTNHGDARSLPSMLDMLFISRSEGRLVYFTLTEHLQMGERMCSETSGDKVDLVITRIFKVPAREEADVTEVGSIEWNSPVSESGHGMRETSIRRSFSVGKETQRTCRMVRSGQRRVEVEDYLRLSKGWFSSE